MNKLSKLIRNTLIRIFACIFTLAITILYSIYKVMLLLPVPASSHLIRDFRYDIGCMCNRIELKNIVHIILNTTLSLISALMIANYCENMLGFVEWISHQTHVVFLSLVFPNFPQATTYTPSWIVMVYLSLGYLGITSQLSLTLDLIYIYNLPAILIYKVLALAYSKLLNAINLCSQVIQYQPSRWLTCEYPILIQTFRVNKIIGIGLLIVLSQILLIVGFYYLWLALVIAILVFLMNILRNIIQVIRSFSSIMLALKGYQIHQIKKQDIIQGQKQKSSRIQLLMSIKISWVPLIKLQDIRDVFLGRDITKLSTHRLTLSTQNLHFNIAKIYECFVESGHDMNMNMDM